MGAILLLILVVFLVAGLPSWPYSRSWGYYPSGLAVLLLVVLLLLILMGPIPWWFAPPAGPVRVGP